MPITRICLTEDEIFLLASTGFDILRKEPHLDVRELFDKTQKVLPPDRQRDAKKIKIEQIQWLHKWVSERKTKVDDAELRQRTEISEVRQKAEESETRQRAEITDLRRKLGAAESCISETSPDGVGAKIQGLVEHMIRQSDVARADRSKEWQGQMEARMQKIEDLFKTLTGNMCQAVGQKSA